MVYPSSGNLSGRWTLREVIKNIRNDAWIKKDDIDDWNSARWCERYICNSLFGSIITGASDDATLCLSTGIYEAIDIDNPPSGSWLNFDWATHPSGDLPPSPLDLKIPKNGIIFLNFPEFDPPSPLCDFQKDDIKIWDADIYCGTGITNITFPKNDNIVFNSFSEPAGIDIDVTFSPSGWILESFVYREAESTPSTSGPPSTSPATTGPPGSNLVLTYDVLGSGDIITFKHDVCNSSGFLTPHWDEIHVRWRRLYEDWTITERQVAIMSGMYYREYVSGIADDVDNGLAGISAWEKLIPSTGYAEIYDYNPANTIQIPYNGISVTGDTDGKFVLTSYYGILPSGDESWDQWSFSSGFLSSLSGEGCYWFPYLRESTFRHQYDINNDPLYISPADYWITKYTIPGNKISAEEIITTDIPGYPPAISPTFLSDAQECTAFGYYSPNDTVLRKEVYSNFYQQKRIIDIIKYCPDNCSYQVVTDTAIDSVNNYTYGTPLSSGFIVDTHLNNDFAYKQAGSCRTNVEFIDVIVHECCKNTQELCKWRWDATGEVAGFPAWVSDNLTDPCLAVNCDPCPYPEYSGTSDGETISVQCDPPLFGYSGVFRTDIYADAVCVANAYRDEGYCTKIIWWPSLLDLDPASYGEDPEATPLLSRYPEGYHIEGPPPSSIISIIDTIHKSDWGVACNNYAALYSGWIPVSGGSSAIYFLEDAYFNFSTKGLKPLSIDDTCLECLKCSSNSGTPITLDVLFTNTCREPDPTLYSLNFGEIEYVTLSTCGQCSFAGLNVYDITDASGYNTNLAESEWGVQIDIDRPCNTIEAEAGYPGKETFSLYFSARYGNRAVPVISGVWYDTSVYSSSDVFLITRQDSPDKLRAWTCRYLRFASKTGDGEGATLSYSWPYNDLYWSYCTGTDIPLNLVPC